LRSSSQRPRSKIAVRAPGAAEPPAARPAAVIEHEEGVRGKLVRDSFTMPKPEYTVLSELKLRAARLGRPTKKGELLRAGVAALRGMADHVFLAALAVVPTLKPGRPRNSHGTTAAETKSKRRRKAS
jgi:hypothetical protein